MALKFSLGGGLRFLTKSFFDNSRQEDLGITNRERSVSQVSEKSFIVGGAANQFTCTAAFTEVMSIEHESKTGKVMVIFSCETGPGVSEQVSVKLQKDGVDVVGQEIASYVNAEPGTEYWNCPGNNFKARDPDVQDIYYTNGNITLSADTINLNAAVFLPHGAVITACIVYGNAAGETWTLKKGAHDSASTTTIASGNIDSASTGLSETVNNNTNKYWVDTTTLDTGDDIRACEITYTPSRWSLQAENPIIPLTLHTVDEKAENNVWRIMAKTSDASVTDNFINDRTLSIMDI